MQHVAEAIALRTALPTLNGRDADFARSLLAGYERYGSFSPKQLPHVVRLSAPAPAAIKAETLYAMMTQAQAKLKRPGIRVFAGDCSYLVRFAGPTSRNAGSLYVYGPGKDYVACLPQDGQLRCSRELSPEKAAEVRKAVTDFCADPHAAAVAYGQRTSSCCFCGKELADAGSVAAGYGPVCATRYGLPHKAAGRAVMAEVNIGAAEPVRGTSDRDDYADEFNDEIGF